MQTCDDIDGWINDLENQVLTAETGQDLTSVNLILQKQQACIILYFVHVNKFFIFHFIQHLDFICLFIYAML